MGGGEVSRAALSCWVRVPWFDRRVLAAVQGTPGMNGCASRRCWRVGGASEGSVPSGETVDSCGCWPTPLSGPRFGLSAMLARGEVGAGAGGAVATEDCGWLAASTPGLQCCLSETVTGGGEADGGVCMPARDGERISTSGSHSTMFSWLSMPSASSMSCGRDVPSSCVGAIPSCLDWISVGGMCVDVCADMCADGWLSVSGCGKVLVCVGVVSAGVRACVGVYAGVCGYGAAAWVTPLPFSPGGSGSHLVTGLGRSRCSACSSLRSLRVVPSEMGAGGGEGVPSSSGLLSVALAVRGGAPVSVVGGVAAGDVGVEVVRRVLPLVSLALAGLVLVSLTGGDWVVLLAGEWP